jgi:hypothetical protein
VIIVMHSFELKALIVRTPTILDASEMQVKNSRGCQCQSLSDDHSSYQTEEQPYKSPNYPFTHHCGPTNVTSCADTPPRSNHREQSNTRFELRIALPASSPDIAFKTVTDTLAKVLAQVWDSDKTALVVPWYNDSHAPPLMSVADIPTTISSL